MHAVRKSFAILGLSLVLGAVHTAQAQTEPGLVTGKDPSLVLLIWDPVAKVSYSRDTGLLGSTLYNTGLTDAGSQQFWTLDPGTDASFAQFIKASPNLAQDQWMVIGGGKSATGTTAGSNVIFSTMVNTVLIDNQPTLNPEWNFLIGVNNGSLRNAAAAFPPSFYNPLNTGNGTSYNNYATAPAGTGSSFDTSSPTNGGYVGNMQPVLSDASTGLSAGEAMFGGGNAGQGFDTGNLIGASGSSSWFYYLTPSATTNSKAVTVDAFSNSAQLAYWGLARTTNTTGQQELVLSFTLPSAIAPTSTVAGALRRSQTDYTAQFGAAQQITLNDQFIGWTPSTLLDIGVTAVPEPSSPLLMLAGLLAVVGFARRRASRASQG